MFAPYARRVLQDRELSFLTVSKDTQQWSWSVSHVSVVGGSSLLMHFAVLLMLQVISVVKMSHF